MRKEPAHCERRIVGEPCLQNAVAEEIASRGAACRGHVRDEDRRAGIRSAKALDERRGGARLAERDGMHPQDSRRRDAAITSVTLADRLAIPGLAPPPPREAQRGERRGRIPQQRIEAAHRVISNEERDA
jgi:hypothetical protein